MLSNKSWSNITPGKAYKIRYVLDGKRSWQGDVTGFAHDGVQGFGSRNLKTQLIEDIARSSRMPSRAGGSA